MIGAAVRRVEDRRFLTGAGRFVDDLGPDARVLLGTCDDLTVPRPLGPLQDLARSVGDGLAEALTRGEDPAEIQRLLIDELAPRGRPAVLVLEDVHARVVFANGILSLEELRGAVPALFCSAKRAVLSHIRRRSWRSSCCAGCTSSPALRGSVCCITSISCRVHSWLKRTPQPRAPRRRSSSRARSRGWQACSCGQMPSGRNAASTLVARFVKQGSKSPATSLWSMKVTALAHESASCGSPSLVRWSQNV